MASEKVTMILLSKTDMTREEVADLSDSDAWGIVYSLRAKKAKDTRLQICFTGFGLSKKNELSELAAENNMNVVASVRKNLDYLCGGDNAGPSKIEKAERQGVQFLDERQFVSLIETGEIPKST